MKRFAKYAGLAVLLCLCLLTLSAALTACDGGSTEDTTPEAPAITDSLEILNNVWALYGDEEKFPAAGGDFSEENASMDGPGKYGVADAEAVQATLNFPAAEIAKIDDAASLIHMMNLNTFTCGAFRTVEGTDVAALAKAIEEQVMNNQWMCGFPEKMFVASVGQYLVSAYGNGELIDNLQAKLTEAYPAAEILYAQNIE